MKRRVAIYFRHNSVNTEVEKNNFDQCRALEQRIKNNPDVEFIGSYIDKCDSDVHPLVRKEYNNLHDKCIVGASMEL